ncbi:MAG: clostripain-related cysteine peptidase [Bacteroides sp.]|nr:clostripain-related cysteine peptidase [Roseburia sp.]MCM1347501.1 clostripain-related cysteine peptidase [Bacteroides sp.]MCM1421638.1 clostripain-related cysteine peptidase [Bacteroides sp.]
MRQRTNGLTPRIVSCIASCLILCSCSDDEIQNLQPDTMSSRTLLIYMVAENSLSGYASMDIQEMLEGAKELPEHDNLVVYLDDTKSPRIYALTNKNKEKRLSELQPTYTFPAEQNSASATVLKTVIEYTRTHYSADSYGIIFWSHASGWTHSDYSEDMSATVGRKYMPRKSFGIDNGRNTMSNLGNQMNIEDMASALSGFPRFEFIMFDACFMQSIEVAYELKDCAHYIIGSPAEIPGEGAPYNKLIVPIFADTPDIIGIINAYYGHYYNDNSMGIALSAVDCDKLDEFADRTSYYIRKYEDLFLNTDYTNTQNYFLYERWNEYNNCPDYYEMQGIMQKVLPEHEYTQWKQTFDKTVIAAQATDYWYSVYQRGRLPIDKEQFGGISMFLPLDKYSKESFLYEYASTQWAKSIGFGNKHQ